MAIRIRFRGKMAIALKEAARRLGEPISAVAEKCLTRALPVILREGTEQLILTLGDGNKFTVGSAGVNAIAESHPALRRAPQLVNSRKGLTPEMARPRIGNRPLCWLFHVYFSKPISAGSTAAQVRRDAMRAWEICREYNCIAFGGSGPSVETNAGLHQSERWAERRQLATLPNFKPGDIVVATLGWTILDWGRVFARPGKSPYEFNPPDLKVAYEEYGGNWFAHVVRCRWKNAFRKPIDVPHGKGSVDPELRFPVQPTVRWPTPANKKAWEYLASLGIPVGRKGRVLLDSNEEE